MFAWAADTGSSDGSEFSSLQQGPLLDSWRRPCDRPAVCAAESARLAQLPQEPRCRNGARWYCVRLPAQPPGSSPSGKSNQPRTPPSLHGWPRLRKYLERSHCSGILLSSEIVSRCLETDYWRLKTLWLIIIIMMGSCRE